jgi:hypothetical protein
MRCIVGGVVAGANAAGESVVLLCLSSRRASTVYSVKGGQSQ